MYKGRDFILSFNFFTKKTFIIIAILVVILVFLIYFLLPVNLSEINTANVKIHISNSAGYYILNQSEVETFINIINNSSFYRGASRPELIFGDRMMYVHINGYSPNLTMIMIYSDENHTYIYSQISTKFGDVYCRVSNSSEIRQYIEEIEMNRSFAKGDFEY